MKTHITFVLDSSGSMSTIEDDIIGGFNSFLYDQRNEEGSATVTLFDFNTDVELVYQGESIKHAPRLTRKTYVPCGRTALYDAISLAIGRTRERIATLGLGDRPENVIIVVLTDGKENASETSQEGIREQVARYREEENWEFLFIGANQDAALTASSMGMDPDRSLSMEHSSEGARAAYDSTSRRISQARQSGSTGGYDESDRRQQNPSNGS